MSAGGRDTDRFHACMSAGGRDTDSQEYALNLLPVLRVCRCAFLALQCCCSAIQTQHPALKLAC
jgi:hypothetical protein